LKSRLTHTKTDVSKRQHGNSKQNMSVTKLCSNPRAFPKALKKKGNSVCTR